MPVRLAEIISSCTMDTGDIARERIEKGSWIDFSRETLNEIAEEIGSWIGKFIVTPNPGFTEYDAATQYNIGDIVLLNSIYYYVWNAPPTPGLTPPNTLYFVPTLYPNNLLRLDWNRNIYKIIRVERRNGNGNFVECRENPLQTIERTVNNEHSFQINRAQLTEYDYASIFEDQTGRHRNLTLVFGASFAITDTVAVSFISDSPFTLTNWNSVGLSGAYNFTLVTDDNPDDLVIPNYMERSVKYGILWRAFARLYFQGDDSCFKRMESSEQLAKKYTRLAAGYTHQLKETTRGLQVQPVNWLEE
jgi:hypothetical protein